VYILVETFRNPGEPSASPIRVRPVEGQGFPTTMRVECSKAMRASAPVGSRFRVWAQLKHANLGQSQCLYVNYRDQWELVP